MDMCYSNNVSFKRSVYDNFFEKLPNKNIKQTAKYSKLGCMLASPHWNRLAIGCAAISTQPFIDFYNPNVDRDTAKASTCRTVAKICTCTTVGCVVRGLCYKLTNKYANASTKEGSTLLTPKEILRETNTEIRNNKLKIHRNAFSTVFALGVMLFTNILLDAPITTKFANTLIDKYVNKEDRLCPPQ